MKTIHSPRPGNGPGSQPSEKDGSQLSYLTMPDGMMTYTPPTLSEQYDITEYPQAIALLSSLLKASNNYKTTKPALSFSMDKLDQHNKEFIEQVLGEGEVSIVFNKGSIKAWMQETRLAGIWRCHEERTGERSTSSNTIELATIPELVRRQTFLGTSTHISTEPPDALNNAVMNAPSLLTELNGRIARPAQHGHTPYSINLSLLPFTAEDQAYTEQQLGHGTTTILSRGYGNCRITATTTANVWWVQYFNSTDQQILNTLEVSEVPIVACAAQEDIDDSSTRLAEILETCQQ